jgi:hypothetical protein
MSDLFWLVVIAFLCLVTINESDKRQFELAKIQSGCKP